MPESDLGPLEGQAAGLRKRLPNRTRMNKGKRMSLCDEDQFPQLWYEDGIKYSLYVNYEQSRFVLELNGTGFDDFLDLVFILQL